MAEDFESSTYYFGRLHIDKKLDYVDEKETKEWIKKKLNDYLQLGEILTNFDDDDFKWYFGGVFLIDDIIIGKMGRVRKRMIKTYYDKSKRDFLEEIVENEGGMFSYFFIDLKKMIIIFERRKIIGQNQFQKVFCEGFNIFCKNKSTMTFDFILDKTELQEIIEKSEKIVSVEFNIRPTNPDMDNESKKIDEELKLMRAKRGILKLENQQDGLNMSDGTILKSSLALCQRGYGNYTLDYVKGGQKNKFSSKRVYVIKSVSRPAGKEDAIQKAKILLAKITTMLGGLNGKK